MRPSPQPPAGRPGPAALPELACSPARATRAGASARRAAAERPGQRAAGRLAQGLRPRNPRFPQPGVIFKDITPLLADVVAFSSVIDLLVVAFGRGSMDKVCGIEARGFILASPVAYHAGAGFFPIRKQGKLPGATVSEAYSLEYGEDAGGPPRSQGSPGDRVLIVDDVLATGGTAAAARLVERLGATVAGFACLIELEFLGGREKLSGYDVVSLLRYA